MFDTTQTDTTVDRLDAAGLLDHARATQAAAQRLDAGLIAAAARWADLHAGLDAVSRGLPGAEALVRLGGDGTPEVAEFCPAELAAELAVSTYAGTALVADALDLRHRLPQVWAKVNTGEVKAWVGRRIAQATRPVSLDAALAVDAVAARWAGRLGWGRLEPVVLAAMLEADPDYAAREATRSRSDRGVWLNADDHGTTQIVVRAGTADALDFDSTVDRVAAGLAALGDTSDRDHRRAAAVGVIANPQQALDLICDAEHPDLEDADNGDGTAGAAPGRRPSRAASRPRTVLHVHLSEEALRSTATGCGGTSGAPGSAGHVARVEGIGPATLDTVREWLGHRHVTIRPVLDPAGVAPVDAYEIPDRTPEDLRSPTRPPGDPTTSRHHHRASPPR